MWIGVTQRFSQFHANLKLTDAQVSDGVVKAEGVAKTLNRSYRGDGATDHYVLVGSWGKNTAIRPPMDVDMIYVLPPEVHDRFELREGNKQSQMLQEVKSILEATYSQTTMRGDGQVVVIAFNTVTIELVPAFLLENGRYLICDTHLGGSYNEADPVAENVNLNGADAMASNNVRAMIRIIKRWRTHCNVEALLKSFQIELLCVEFFGNYAHGCNNFYWYDWFVRDFFGFLLGKSNGSVIVPGTWECIDLGEAWVSRATTAHNRALKACDYERDDMVIHAGEEWQKIFGDMIPKNV